MRPAVTLLAEASGILRVWILLAWLQVGDVPATPGVANVCVAPVSPLRLERLPPTTPITLTAEPSQYLVWLVVVLNQVLPLSPPPRGVATKEVSWVSVSVPRARVFWALSARLPTPVRSKPPTFQLAVRAVEPSFLRSVPAAVST